MAKLVALFTIVAVSAFSDFKPVAVGDLIPGDIRFTHPIDVSQPGQLTIASFNVRNLGDRLRSLSDLEAIVDLVDEADVVLFQEAGLGVFDADPTVSVEEQKRLDAVMAVFKVYFGPGWELLRAPQPSGDGAGAETTILAYRAQVHARPAQAHWKEYADLGPRRDCGVFDYHIAGRSFLLASVHLKPDDPVRGQEMIRAADWLVETGQAGQSAILMGDFNWGYKREPRVENYLGETHVSELHQQQRLYQVFANLSYIGSGNAQRLRTNMGFRKTGQFYDQFLLTPDLADNLADGGRLLEDCGFLAFELSKGRMGEVVERRAKDFQYGAGKLVDALKNRGISGPLLDAAIAEVDERINTRAEDDATYYLSDHRVIWVQLSLDD